MAFYSHRLAPLCQIVVVASVLVVSASLRLLVFADGSGVPGGIAAIAAAEAKQRQDQVTAAQTLFTAGSKAFSDKSYGEAMDYFKAAFDTIPDVPAVADQRRIFFKRYQSAAFQYATILAAEAKWAESEQTLADIVALAESANVERTEIDPGVSQMLDELRNFDDRYNQATSPRHLRNIDLVEGKLIVAKGYLQLGDYDRADRTYNEVLAIDPFSTAARRGLEDVERHRMNYYDAAYNHTRAKQIAEIGAGWESPVPSIISGADLIFNDTEVAAGGKVSLERKLKEIVIPRVEFREARLLDVIEFLSQKAQELDASGADPAKRGVNIVIDSSGIPGGEDAGQRTLSVSLSNIPLGVALKYAAQQVGMVYRADNYAVRVISMNVDDSGEMVSRRFIVPPGFLSSGGGGAEASAPADPFASPTPGAGAGALVERITAQKFLEDRGVQFGPGSSATFIAASNSLVVKNTSQQLETIESIVAAARDSGPKNVEVHVKIVSIEAELLNQLGLDFLLGQSSFGGADDFFFSGGTSGNALNPGVDADYPFTDINGPIGLNPVTAGLRTGNVGNLPGIDGIINLDSPQPVSGKAPGVFTVAGIFTNPQFQLVTRALSQSKGTDLLCDAHVTVKPGQLAHIELVRDFIYPTEYEPPEVPQPILNNNDTDDTDDVDTGTGSGFLPVTPSHPTAFETRKLGKMIDVEPTVAADNKTVNVNILMDFTEFSGFINYGSPITAQGILLTDNEILMPVFDAIKETTNVNVWDGQTIAIGGFHGESVIDTEDKVPLLGDLPVIGRGFRSSTSQRLKRAITVFVTINLVDPGGNPINLPLEEDSDLTYSEPTSPIGTIQSGPPPALPYDAK